MRLLPLLLLAVFTFQILDLPAPANRSNPKTCCGRAVCLCKHEKGALCPFRHGMKAAEEKGQDGYCRLHANQKKNQIPDSGVLFTKAPCAGESPKAAASFGYSRDFNLVPRGEYPFNAQREFLASPVFPVPGLIEPQGIDRPPRIF